MNWCVIYAERRDGLWAGWGGRDGEYEGGEGEVGFLNYIIQLWKRMSSLFCFGDY
jgi:hypothetical protein